MKLKIRNKIWSTFFRLLALIKFHNFINHEHFDKILHAKKLLIYDNEFSTLSLSKLITLAVQE